jgi:nucleoside-diphosphate-sugar epimerase
MNVLVIGHSSFIAQHLKQHPIAKEWDYISYKGFEKAPEWNQNPSCVINLALDSAVRQGQYSDLDLKIGKKAQKLGAHFIALSTRAVYGTSDKFNVFTEKSPFLEHCTPYGQAKRQIEEDLLKNLDNKKLTILRPSNIFGFEYQTDQPRKSFFGQMLYDLKNNSEINFNMSPATHRDFLPVEEFVDIIVEIANDPKSGIFNVGSSIGTPCGDIAGWVMEGYRQGALKIKKGSETTDGFIINSQKLLSSYPLSITCPDKGVIQRACLTIGEKLRQEN